MRTLRISFEKTGEAAYISHLDLQRVMARALRKSGLPVWYSQGFNPHIYMSFALPLPLGQQSLCEKVDVKTESEEDVAGYVAALDAALPRGIAATGIGAPVLGPEKITSAEYVIKYPQNSGLEKIEEKYNEIVEAVVVRKTKRTQQPFDLKTVLPALALAQGGADAFAVRLPAGSEMNLNPALLTGFLEAAFGLPAGAATITRQRVYAGAQLFE